MLELNQTHLDHDTHTDIITFDYGDSTSISAEIYISTDQCEENAQIFNVSIENETLRLISHGFLHCIGYNDKNEEEKNQMRNKKIIVLNCSTWIQRKCLVKYMML